MTISGRIHHGVVVLDGAASLPEGLAVVVSVPPSANTDPALQAERVSLPLVPSKYPGSRRLNAESVAELLEDRELLEDSELLENNDVPAGR